MTTKRVRARTTSAELLDQTLCLIQDGGGTVYQILPYNAGITGEAENVGKGREELGFVMSACFVITYSEGAPTQ